MLSTLRSLWQEMIHEMSATAMANDEERVPRVWRDSSIYTCGHRDEGVEARDSFSGKLEFERIYDATFPHMVRR